MQQRRELLRGRRWAGSGPARADTRIGPDGWPTCAATGGGLSRRRVAAAIDGGGGWVQIAECARIAQGGASGGGGLGHVGLGGSMTGQPGRRQWRIPARAGEGVVAGPARSVEGVSLLSRVAPAASSARGSVTLSPRRSPGFGEGEARYSAPATSSSDGQLWLLICNSKVMLRWSRFSGPWGASGCPVKRSS